ncbi:polysaccharide biosynthesis/export family protein [Xanthobacteraceae bacterium A53D]
MTPTSHSQNERPLAASRIFRIGLAFSAALALSACAAPSGSGPTSFGAEHYLRADGSNVPIIDLTRMSPSAMASTPAVGLSGMSGGRGSIGTLRPGDKIDVKIFDTGEGGLLSAAESKSLQLGTFQVGQDGMVNLPYVGKLQASGRTSAALQEEIAEKLRGNSVSPQASVFVSDAGGSGFTVSGAVKSSGEFSLDGKRRRVLEAIAMAGGPVGSPSETEVTVIRGERRQSVSMDRLLSQPSQNIFVQPEDQIFLRRSPTTFTSFGAFRSPGEFPFQPGELTMAQAVARSGGLQDDRANPQKVYLFRYVSAPIARQLGILQPEDPRTDSIPVAYLLDLTQPQAFFLMQQIQMERGDMLYVPNSPTADFSKIFQIFERAAPAAPAPQPPSGY